MKAKQILGFFLLLVLTVTIASKLHGQSIARLLPASSISFRGVSMGSLWTAMAVGDSATVIVTHSHDTNAFGVILYTPLQPQISTSVTLYAVAYCGDTLHAVIGGSGGTLSFTSDGGATWTPVVLGTSATIRAITFNKSATADVLIGVGDGGLVIRSTDQGQTWNTIPSTTSAQLNAISFGTPNDAVAVGNDTTLIQTHDAGQTWTTMVFPFDFRGMRVENGPGTDSVLLDTIIQRIDFVGVAMGGADSVFVAMARPLGPLLIYRGAADTTHIIVRYFKIKSTPYHEVTFTSLTYVGMPGLLTTLGCTLSDVLYYNDTGQTIRGQYFGIQGYTKIGDADGGYVRTYIRYRAAAVWKEDTTVVAFFAGDLGIFQRWLWTPKSVNHQIPVFLLTGTLKAPGTAAAPDWLGVSILPNGRGYSVGVGENLGRTTDRGKTWIKQKFPIYNQRAGISGGHDSSINTVYTLDTSTAIIIGWAGVILETDPSGFHFRASGTQDRLHGIAFPSADTGIIVGDFGTVLQSPDRGVTWNSISTPTSQYLYSVAFANDVVGIAVGDSGTILRTTDEGVTWRGVNNLFTGTNVSIRQVQAFADGTFFAQAWTYLIRSTDFGENWQTVNLPVGDSCGMSFYSPQTGIVAEQMTSSAFAPDTAYFSYTTNAGATWQPFKITMSAYYHILFYWLNDHEALLYGNGFIEDVNLSPSGVTVSRVDNAPQIQVYPNPSIGEVRVDYATKTNGPVQIELWDETGKKVATLFRGEETVGAHEQILDLSKSEHGAYYIRVTQDGTTSTAPITIE